MTKNKKHTQSFSLFDKIRNLSLCITIANIMNTWKQASADIENIEENYTNDELEFLPAVLEVLETPYNPIGRILLYSIISMFSIALLWSVIGKMDIVINGTGKIIPAGGYVKIIQSSEGGIVDSIYVKDGDEVNKGDLIVQLKGEQSKILKSNAYNAMNQNIAEVQYYSALLESYNKGALSLGNFTMVSVENSLLYNKRLFSEFTEYLDLKESITNRKEKIGTDISTARMNITVGKGKLKNISAEHKVNLKLYKQKLASKLLIKKSKQKLKTYKNIISIEKEKIKGFELTRKSLSADEKKLKNNFKNVILSRLIKYKKALKAAQLEYQSLNKIHIKSPIDGAIQQLQTHTVGGVVKPADTIAIVVPHSTSMVIETYVLSKDAVFIKKGHSVKIKVNSFPFTKYGYLKGKVKSISADSMEHQVLGNVYKIYVSLSNQNITTDGRIIDINVGMNTFVEIKTGTRRIIEYLLSPLM